MNIIQFKRTLKKYSYSKPKVNYKFLNKIVLRVSNADIAVTPKLSYDQYKLFYKIAFNLCLLVFIVGCNQSVSDNNSTDSNTNNNTPVNQVQDMMAHKLWSMSVAMIKIVRITK